MKRLILLAGVLFLTLKLVAQSFTYSGGGVNVFNVIAKADNGNSIVGGVMNSNGISQPFITKLDAQMQSTWTKVIPSLSSCEVYDILYDATSNTYWLAGTINSSQRRAFIVKFDASGTVIFSKTYVTIDDDNTSNPALRGLNKISTGGQDYFVVTGFTDRDQNSGDMLAFCIDTNGSVVWQKSYDPGGFNVNHANDAVFTSGNRLFITGVCLETSTVQIMEVNVTNGNLIQGANFDANGMYISIYDVVELQNGNLVAAGSYISNGVREAFAFCVNTNMDLIWQKRYYNTSNNPTFNIEIGSNGTVYINGFSTESNGDQNLVVLGVSPTDGSVITSKAYGKAGAFAFESTGFHSAIIDGNDFIGVGKSTGFPLPQGNANGAAYLVKGDVTEQTNSNCNAISANFVATDVPMNRNSGGMERTLSVSALSWEIPNSETLSSINNCGCVITPIIITNSTTICTGNSTILTASGGDTYLWSNGASSTAITVSPSTATTYTVTVSNASGCTGSTWVTISVASNIAIINGSNLLCLGATSTLSVQGNGSYAWSNGVNTASNTITANGLYSVTVTDLNGCTASAQINITTAPPLSSVLYVDSINCNGGNDGDIYVNVLTGTGPYNYDWGNNTSDSTLQNVAAGVYTVTVTDAAGCTSSLSATLANPPLFAIQVTPSDTSVYFGGEATLITTGNTPAAYQWANDNSLSSFTTQIVIASPMIATTYVVTATSTMGCTASASANVYLEGQCIVKMPNAFTPNDDNYNDEFGILVSTPYTILDEFSIYNRWGERLFMTNSLSLLWDGKVENKDCAADVYVYTVKYHCPSDNKEVELHGDVTLMR